jgi:2-polyprenyl-3-methyl-5-hydroxy-6-metoxy-1,4-benzoquinol methylase
MPNEKWANPQKMWDERFGQAEPVYGVSPNAFLEAQAKRWAPGARVLVPGDGYGRNGIWLARRGFQVSTVDLSPVGVERSRKAAAAAHVQMTIECADLAKWNWPVGEFDVVASIFVHLSSDVRPRIHHSMVGTLKPDGLLVLEAFSPAQLQYSSGGPKQTDLLYNAEALRRDFAGAEILELGEQVVNLSEGTLHSGLGAVVRGVFRKI